MLYPKSISLFSLTSNSEGPKRSSPKEAFTYVQYFPTYKLKSLPSYSTSLIVYSYEFCIAAPLKLRPRLRPPKNPPPNMAPRLPLLTPPPLVEAPPELDP